jgi:hypothetical protein
MHVQHFFSGTNFGQIGTLKSLQINGLWLSKSWKTFMQIMHVMQKPPDQVGEWLIRSGERARASAQVRELFRDGFSQDMSYQRLA